MSDFKGKVTRNLSRLKDIHKKSKQCYFKIITQFLRLHSQRGFSLQEFHDFEFDRFPKSYLDNFLNAREQEFYLTLLNPRKYYSLARNKYLTHVILDRVGIKNKAQLYCYYNPETRINSSMNISYNVDSTIQILQQQNVEKCVVKTTESSHGDNVWVIKTIHYLNNDAEMIRFDNHKILLSELLKQEPLIFESAINQTKQISRFNASSINTIRFMTTLYPNGKAKIIATFIKIGRAGKCVDNAGGGGNVDAAIDIESGKLYNTIEYNGFRKTKPIEIHPDSKNQIEGTVIDNWNEIKAKVIEFQQALPFVKAAGWDIAITDNGPMVIEVNDMWDRTGQLFLQRGWKSEIKDCYEEWKQHYKL